MKFLKTFLFTISFCFIFGSIMSLCGYCEALPVLTPDSSSLQVIQGGGMPYYYGMQGYGEMYFMSPEFNQGLNDVGISIDDWLETNTGYNSDQLIVNAGSEIVDRIDEAGFGSGNPSGGLDSQTAQWLANRMSTGLNNGIKLSIAGYSLLRQNVPQFGQNAYQWFLGKVDNVTGVVSDVCDNFVTKITSSAISNYLDCTDSLLQDNVLSVSENSFIYTKHCQFYSTQTSLGNNTIINFTVNSSNPLFFFTVNHRDFPDSNGNKLLICAVPESLIAYVSGNNNQYKSIICDVAGNYLGGSSFVGNTLDLANCYTLSLNGENYVFGNVVNSAKYSVYVNYSLGDYSTFFDFINSVPPSVVGSDSVGYRFTSETAQTINNLLSELVGKWVDNQSMKKINDIIKTIPIVPVVPDGQQEPIPQLQLDPDTLDALEGAIDEAVTFSDNYARVLPDPEPDPEPEPEPEPSPNNQGTEVPEDFPTTIFTPINDSVGSMFDFVSIFEPLFYIFSFSAGLLGLWFVVPFVILFLILFRLLK